MATESPVRMLPSGGMRAGIGGPLSDGLGRSSAGAGGGQGTTSPTRGDGVGQELNRLFNSRSRFETVFTERGGVPQRSGSAPPSVEGSLRAMSGLFGHSSSINATSLNQGANQGVGGVGGKALQGVGETFEFKSEHELRSDPSYLEYYYTQHNVNPRLPPPLISRENWRLAQQLQSGVLPRGGIGDKRKLTRSVDDINSRSLFSTQPLLPTHREELEPLEENSPHEHLARQSSVDWLERGGGDGYSTGMSGMGARPKSLVDLIQEDFPRTPSPVYNHSRSSSRAANEADGGDGVSVQQMEGQFSNMREPSITAAELQQEAAMGSRSTTPMNGAKQLLGAAANLSSSGPAAPLPTDSPTGSRSASPALPQMQRSLDLGSRQASLSAAASAAELAAALQGFSLSDVQAAADEREQFNALQLQQELKDQQQQQQVRLHQQQQQYEQQQQQQHSRQQQITDAQNQARAQAYSQALQQQQQFPGVDPSAFRGQAANFGVPTQQGSAGSLQPALQAGVATPMYAAAVQAMSYMTGSPNFQGMPYAPQYGLDGDLMNPALLAPMMAGYPAPGTLPVGFDQAAAAAAAVAAYRGSIQGSPAQAAVDVQNLYKFSGLPPQIPDPNMFNMHQYLCAAEEAKNSCRLLERKVEELEAALKDSQKDLQATQRERAAERTGRIRAQQELRNALVGNNCENASMTAYPMTPIGTVRSCFSTRNGTPRQPLLVTQARACLELTPGGVPAEAFEGLIDYSHCWLLYVFHENTDLPRLWKKPAHSDFKAKVHVPRLDGKKVGVLATRTPHRPLPIGLTVAKIEGVHRGRLFISGADLVDGTPVLDVKPYLPYCDAVPDSRAPSFVQAGDADDIIAVQSVELTDTFKNDLADCWTIMGKYSLYPSPEELQGLLKQVLSRDIRSLNQRHKPHAAKLSVLADIVRGTAVSEVDDPELLSTILPATTKESTLRGCDDVQIAAEETDVEVLYHVLVEGINVGYTQDTKGRVIVKAATVLQPLKNTSDTKNWWKHFTY